MGLWLSILMTMIVGVSLWCIYNRREQEEIYLGWKLLGYYLLGTFTVTIQEWSLPLGFFIFLAFFNPSSNKKAKTYTVYLGLIVYVARLVIPSVQEAWFERERDVEAIDTNWYSMNWQNEYVRICKELSIHQDAKLEDFKAVITPQGQLHHLDFELTTFHGKQEYIHYFLRFIPKEKKYTVRASKLNSWLQYDRLIHAESFFQMLDSIPLKNIISKHDDNYFIIESEGEEIHYAIEGHQKFKMVDDKIIEIDNSELPITGYYFTLLRGDTEDEAWHIGDYFFHVVKENDTY
jgi:hypothetical protein